MTKRNKQLALLVGDIIILYSSLYLALIVRWSRYSENFNINIFLKHILPFTILYSVWLIIFFIADLYNPKIIKNTKKLFVKLFNITLINALIATAFFYLFPFFIIKPKINLFLTLIISSAFIVIWRIICNQLIHPSYRKNNLLFININNSFLTLKNIDNYVSFGYEIKAVILDENKIPKEIKKLLENKKIKIYQGIDNIKKIIQENHINTIIVNDNLYQNISPELYEFIYADIDIYNFSTFWEKFNQSIPISSTNKIWFLNNLKNSKKNTYESIKRITDIIFSLLLGIISLIFYPFVFLGIITTRGSIFYRQKRVKKNNEIFKILKFRTMFLDSEQNGAQWAKRNDSRVTKFGKFLRKTRLDEFPQLWNILKGEMSFIGPRPERPEFIEKLSKQIPHYDLRHLIKPGLTGWAQVKYPYGSSVNDSQEKLCYDLYYLKNRTSLFDVNIILKTIAIVLSRKGY